MKFFKIFVLVVIIKTKSYAISIEDFQQEKVHISRISHKLHCIYRQKFSYLMLSWLQYL